MIISHAKTIAKTVLSDALGCQQATWVVIVVDDSVFKLWQKKRGRMKTQTHKGKKTKSRIDKKQIFSNVIKNGGWAPQHMIIRIPYGGSAEIYDDE